MRTYRPAVLYWLLATGHSNQWSINQLFVFYNQRIINPLMLPRSTNLFLWGGQNALWANWVCFVSSSLKLWSSIGLCGLWDVLTKRVDNHMT